MGGAMLSGFDGKRIEKYNNTVNQCIKKDKIDLRKGQSGNWPPEVAVNEAVRLLKTEKAPYPAATGCKELKTAIINAYKPILEINENQILVTNGARHAVSIVLRGMAGMNYHMILPAPYWPPSGDMAERMFKSSLHVLKTNDANNFKMTPAELQKLLLDYPKALIYINNPVNPTGVVYSKEELQALGKVIKKYPECMVLSDDMYDDLCWSKEPCCNILSACPELSGQTFLIKSFSKATAMAGWRVGYIVCPEQEIEKLYPLYNEVGPPPDILQKGAAIVLSKAKDVLKKRGQEYKKLVETAVDGINGIVGFHCNHPEATFYLFPNVHDAIAKLRGVKDEIGFVEYLFEKTGIACMPGSQFGTPGHIRLCIGSLDDNQVEAIITKIKETLDQCMMKAPYNLRRKRKQEDAGLSDGICWTPDKMPSSSREPAFKTLRRRGSAAVFLERQEQRQQPQADLSVYSERGASPKDHGLG